MEKRETLLTTILTQKINLVPETYTMGFHRLVNTQYFREAGLQFIKNGGYYTRAPQGSREYRDFWDLWEERCKNGMKVGDTWIPGRHVWYLNFTPIMKVPDNKLRMMMADAKDKRGKITRTALEKIFEFPRFYEIDYEWYNFKDIAWHGGEFMGVSSVGAQHIGCAKARGAGFSYKEASDGCYNYTFIPRSKSYYFAGIEQYLTTDGILNKAKDMLDFINDHCPEWAQNRMKSDQLMRMKASYIDGFGVERGNFSEIIGVIVDNPNKTRGKRGRKITFEEAGSFKNLKKALKISLGSIQDGGVVTGQISLFGTGGEEGPSIEGLEDIFNNPREYDMLAFPNIYEEGMEATEIGYFVPVYRTNPMFMDEDGNCDYAGNIEYELQQREREKRKPDPREYDGYCAEYPIYPSEVFQRVTVNPFLAKELKAQEQRIKRSAAIQDLLRYGEFYRDDNSELQFLVMPKHEARPIENYPHTKEDNLEGTVTMIERPYRDRHGKIPKGLYMVIFDPYYKEESEDISSLFTVYVMKMYNNVSPENEGMPVAWYRGRPQDLDRAYKMLFDLSEYYDADVQGEIVGGGQGVLDYAKTHKLLHRLRFEPEVLFGKEINKNFNRSYLMNMPTERKRMGLTYVIDWHKQLRSIDKDGRRNLTLHRYYDIVGVREMMKFNGKRNADTISTLIVGMFELREQVYQMEKEQEQEAQSSPDNFYRRELYPGGSPEEDVNSYETTTSY